MQQIQIYTDGACSGNPGPGGWGMAAYEKNTLVPFDTDSGYLLSTTNNQAELTAVVHALEFIAASSALIFQIYTDSAYICNCINQKWYKRWLVNGWKNAAKQPVANRKLWERIIELYNYQTIHYHKTINFYKVHGHSTDERNNYVDELATEQRNIAKEKVNEHIDTN